MLTKEDYMAIIADKLNSYGYTRNNPLSIIPNRILNFKDRISGMGYTNLYINASYAYIDGGYVFVADLKYDEVTIDCLQYKDVVFLANTISASLT